MEEKTFKIQVATREGLWPSAREYMTILDSPAFQQVQESYLPWAELRQKAWAGAEPEKFWWTAKMARRANQKSSPIADVNGQFFQLDPHRHSEFLHKVDLELGGTLSGTEHFNAGDRRQIIHRNLIEESIASSKLEGANSSREVARRMLNEGRKPRDKSERMIVNNHAAMASIEAELKFEPMSIDLLQRLHRQVTVGTLADPILEGRLRETFNSKGNRLVITPWDDRTVTYVTPDKEFVEQQLQRFVTFANSNSTGPEFIHPVVKAIMLHFWIGLLHPFEDGNGRLARIIFYWYMLRKDYWAFSYLSLSEVILKSPKQYAMAFVYSEQDDHDLNYFIQYNVDKLKQARAQLETYLKQRLAEHQKQALLLRQDNGLNVRQARLIQYLVEDSLRQINVTAYNRMNQEIGYVTAVNDLKTLVEKGLLEKRRAGRNVNYRATANATKLFL
jgi:Fic family protein